MKRGKIETSNTQIHIHSLDTSTSIRSGGEDQNRSIGPKIPSEYNGRDYNVLKGIQAVIIDLFLSMLKVANIRYFILIKCSEQEARFKKICYNVVISEKNSN
jgi:hypothetical protein